MANRELSLDQIALRKGFWEPESDDEVTFCTHRLRQDGEQRVVFRPAVEHIVFRGFWIVLFAACAPLGPLVKLGVVGSARNLTWRGALVWFLLCAFMAGLGVVQLRSAIAPIWFDKRSGFTWRGKEGPPDDPELASGRGGRVALAEIVALQVLAEVIHRRRTGRFTGYELNLVLANGKRVNVVDHAKKRALVVDAEALGKFLGVPVLAGQVKYED